MEGTVSDAKELRADATDGSLLQRFVSNRDQGAFSALVERHEQLVLNICQRVLGDSHLAQDVFQATFAVLARKAIMLDQKRPLAGWLYRVAYHLALRCREVAARQRRSEIAAANVRRSWSGSESVANIEKQEIHLLLQEELQRLPEKYRVPVFLCYFDGKTHDEIARAIGVPRGSIAKRIGEGLQQLRERLIYRGVTF
jgi:RNA polymerase sigma factor (sigma-70 family)